MASDKVVYKY